MSSVNDILASKANNAQMIDFSISEENTLSLLNELTNIEIISNFQHLFMLAIRFNYIDVVKFLIKSEPSYKYRRYSNIELELKSLDMIKYCDNLGIISYDFLNYIILERFIKTNDIEAVKFLIDKIGLDNLSEEHIKNFTLRGRKRKMKDYLKGIGLV
jgi:hypothetical protein